MCAQAYGNQGLPRILAVTGVEVENFPLTRAQEQNPREKYNKARSSPGTRLGVAGRWEKAALATAKTRPAGARGWQSARGLTLDPERSETLPEPHGARAHRTAALFWFLFYESLLC